MISCIPTIIYTRIIKMNTDEKCSYITRRVSECIGLDKLREIVSTRPLKIYWGTAPTSSPHIAYFAPLFKIVDFLAAGCEVTILIADVHAQLENGEDWSIIDKRSEYYKIMITEMLLSIGANIDNVRFVKGSDYQLSKEYVMDLFKLTTKTKLNKAIKAGSEVVKQNVNPKLSSVLYPLLQALDEKYLGVDAQLGGIDQRKIFTFSNDNTVEEEKRIYLMNSIIPGLTNTNKMSASDPNSKIDLLDSRTDVETKIKKAYCPISSEENSILAIARDIIFPSLNGTPWAIDTWGRNLVYSNFSDLEVDFLQHNFFAHDLKRNVSCKINELLNPIRSTFSSTELKDLTDKAYPKENVIVAKSKIDCRGDIKDLQMCIGRIMVVTNEYIEVDIGEKQLRRIVIPDNMKYNLQKGENVIVITNIKGIMYGPIYSEGFILYFKDQGKYIVPRIKGEIGKSVGISKYPNVPLPYHNTKKGWSLDAYVSNIKYRDGKLMYKYSVIDVIADE